MAFLKNKKQQRILSVAILFLSGGVFFLTPFPVHAINLGIGDALGTALNVLLYGVFEMVGWFASIAITLFSWAINPEYVSGATGFLNKESVYEMWKFIRDFFNLFFILTLLYTAFTIVFQVASNYKKTLLSIVLAALFVNFSFPITRVIIDITNVPMYYFVNTMGAVEEGQKSSIEKVMGSVLSATEIKNILVPPDKSLSSMTVVQMLMAIVFLFIFSCSLLVLAVMFIIRLVALLVLLIFSSVGFAASVIPGLGSYGSMWWEKLWKYALFGPAAMLMLVVATRFFAEISNDGTREQFRLAATGNAAGGGTAEFLGAAAMFSIPIVMLWMTISMGSKLSEMGGGMISGKGQKLTKWLARNNPVSYPARKFSSGVAQGAKARFEDSSFGKLFSGPSKIEMGGKALSKGAWSEKGVRGTFQGEKAKLHQKDVNEAIKKNKENQVSDSAHIKTLGESHDPFEKEVAALSLAESKGIRSADVLADALKAVGKNPDAVNKVLESARSEAIGSVNKETNEKILDSFYETDAQGKKTLNPKMKDAYDTYNSKLKKEGQIKVRVDYEIEQRKAAGENEAEARSKVYGDILNKMSADDLAKQGSIHSALASDAALKEFLKEKVEKDPNYYLEAFKKMSAADRTKWTEQGINPEKKQTTGGSTNADMRAKIQGIKKEHGR